MELKKISLGKFTDPLIGADYELFRFENAKALSDQLKTTYNKKGIDYNLFNSETLKEEQKWGRDEKEHKSTLSNPPQEIYEYQNFFLMENTNNEYILLDGFRRLLYYTATETAILVRVYKQDELSDQEILTLLVYLNHFKMIGSSGGYYFDRGFALLLHSVFGLNIHPYSDTFDAYLTEIEVKNSYSNWNKLTKTAENLTLKQRIINPHFILDIRFIQELVNEKGYMINKYFGVLLNQERQKSNKPFNIEEFKRLHKESTVLPKLMEKFDKIGTSNSSDSIKVVNQIIEIYQGFFVVMNGGVVEKTYAEVLAECQALNETLKKDKSFIKLTGNKKDYLIECIIKRRIANKEPVEFKAVIYPYFTDDGYSSSNGRTQIPAGINDKITFLGYVKGRSVMSSKNELELGFIEDGRKFVITHNSNGYYGYSTKYFEIGTSDFRNNSYKHKIMLYVKDITKAQIEEEDKNRLKPFIE